ncbi:hypothetical protein AUI06_10815 [archaeon 13_2_20CM_2_52_21]|nr:MAG: hypothetical protein AUI06_10815 [archaeon 13_2_20CM_2_52_21]
MKERIKSIVFHDAKVWRRWLKVNHDRTNEIWLGLTQEERGRRYLQGLYNQALEEALCFGWIDSRIKPLDATRRWSASHQGRTRTGRVTTSTESLNW